MSSQHTFLATWFNPLYFHLNHYLKDNSIRKVMVYGGKSSAKTFSIAQFLLIRSYFESVSCLAYRKEQTSIKTTLKQTFIKGIELNRMSECFTIMDFFIRSAKGNQIVFKGLDVEGKIKGIEGFKYLLFDELDHFLEEDWDQANLSLRGLEGVKLFGTWNPVDEDIWIKKKIDAEKWIKLPNEIQGNPLSKLHDSSFVHISEDGKTLLIKTTYHDNKWIVGGNGYGYRDENLIYEYEKLKNINKLWYNVNVLGEWGIRNKDSKFAYSFNEDKHTGTCELLDKEAIYLSFDFNRDPISCTVFQEKDGVIRVPYVIKLATSNIYELCDHIIAKFGRKLFMVTGDATGKSSSAMVQDDINYYTIIRQKLNLSSGQLHVPSVNPRVRENRVLVNAILEHKKVLIDKVNAAPLIYDLLYCEVDGNGDLVKDRSNDKRKADILDEFRYYLNTYHGDFLEMVGR